MSDLVALVGILGGAAITALFPARTDLFGAYGIGLFIGFFGYFVSLIILVSKSKKFGSDWFLDGRRKKLEEDETVGDIRGTISAMIAEGQGRGNP